MPFFSSLQPYSDAYALGEGEAIGLALADAVINDALYNNGEAAGDFDRQNQILSTPDSTLSFFVQEAYVSCNFGFIDGATFCLAGNLPGCSLAKLCDGCCKRYFRQWNQCKYDGNSCSGGESTVCAVSRNDPSSFFKFDLILFLYRPVSVHLLAILCIVTGLSLSVIYYLHAQQRRNLHLADRPSTLGVAGALFARGRVAELLDPRDTNKDIERKLAGMKFKLDSETGAVERVDGDMV